MFYCCRWSVIEQSYLMHSLLHDSAGTLLQLLLTLRGMNILKIGNRKARISLIFNFFPVHVVRSGGKIGHPGENAGIQLVIPFLFFRKGHELMTLSETCKNESRAWPALPTALHFPTVVPKVVYHFSVSWCLLWLEISHEKYDVLWHKVSWILT